MADGLKFSFEEPPAAKRGRQSGQPTLASQLKTVLDRNPGRWIKLDEEYGSTNASSLRKTLGEGYTVTSRSLGKINGKQRFAVYAVKEPADE